MRRSSAVAALLLLAACSGQEISPEEQALQDERDVAMVEAANDVAPPLRQVTPEPITAADIERYDLFGEACNYAPGTSLGTRVIARASDAFFKLEGKVVRLAADAGSRELAASTRTLYSGKEYSLRLAIDGEGEPAPSGAAINYEGSVSVRDAHGREVYEGTGLAQCSD